MSTAPETDFTNDLSGFVGTHMASLLSLFHSRQTMFASRGLYD